MILKLTLFKMKIMIKLPTYKYFITIRIDRLTNNLKLYIKKSILMIEFTKKVYIFS